MRQLALAAALLLALAPAVSRAQDDSESDAVADLMQGLANGVEKKVDSKIADDVIGWTLTSLGLGNNGSADAAILDALAEIEQTLIEIETELADVIEILQETECENAADVAAVQNAVDAIDSWVGRGASPAVNSYLDLVDDAQENVDVTDRMVTLFGKVLNGDPPTYPPLEELLVGLDDALRDQASAVGVLSACGRLIDEPTSTWDDRAYFQQLNDLVGYYAEYQARGALLLVEAYHWNALQAWLKAGNDSDSIAQEEVPSICANATGDVLTACTQAQDGFANVRTNLRAQYGETGASYGSGTPDDSDADFAYDPDDPVVQMHNGTGYVWVKNIDDFFAKGGYSTACQTSTSNKPCGPGVGTYDLEPFAAYGTSEPLRYGANGGYTIWGPAPVSEWTALAEPWSGSSTTFGDLLTDTHGLVGASTARVYFTGDVDTTGHHVSQENVGGSNQWHFDAATVACFIATPMNKGNSNQPFCSSGFDNLMHGARDHSQSSSTCYTANSTDHGTLDDAKIDSPFFDFLYTMQASKCKSSSHPEGQTFYPAPPGWLVEYRSWKSDAGEPTEGVSEDTGIVAVPSASLQAQYHWPVIDANTIACTAEPATGQIRNRYALNGRTQLPKMCGDDFDAWFDKWIAPPANLQSAPALQTPEPIVQELPRGATGTLAPHEITLPVDYAAQVRAVDVEDGELPVACFPASGTAFQLGTTEVRCHATDRDGATSEALFPVSVRFPFRFVGRIDDRGVTRARAGATLTVAFSLGGDRGLDAVVAGGLTAQEVDCDSGAALAAPEPARSRTGLRWQRKPGVYRFAWATARSWQGSCRELRIALVDGSEHAARVAFAPHGRAGHGKAAKPAGNVPPARPRHARR